MIIIESEIYFDFYSFRGYWKIWLKLIKLSSIYKVPVSYRPLKENYFECLKFEFYYDVNIASLEIVYI